MRTIAVLLFFLRDLLVVGEDLWQEPDRPWVCLWK